MFPLEKAHVWLCLLSELGLFKLFTFSRFITRGGRCLEEGSPGRGQPVQQAAVGKGMPAEALAARHQSPQLGPGRGALSSGCVQLELSVPHVKPAVLH